MMPDLDGKWTGELIYDDSFGKLAHETLFFVVVIDKTGDEFKGIYLDIDGIGMNASEARVMGFVQQEYINFVKECRSANYSEKDNGILNPENKQGSQISFSGFFNDSSHEFEGEWISFTDFRAFNNNVPGQFKGGTWRMRKQV